MSFINVMGTRIRIDHISALTPPKHKKIARDYEYYEYVISLSGGQDIVVTHMDEKEINKSHEDVIHWLNSSGKSEFD